MYSKRLAPLIRKIERIDQSNVCQEQLVLLKKAKIIALEEKRWDAYLIVIYYTLYLIAEFSYGANESVNYCTEYLRFVKNHADDALEQSDEYEYHKALICCSLKYVADIYCAYPQVNDEQLNSVLKILLETVQKFGSEYVYWETRLKIDIHNKNEQAVRESLSKCMKKMPDDECYVCKTLRFEKGYLMLKEIDNAAAMRNDVIADRIPNDYEQFKGCINGTVFEQNRCLLVSAVCLGMPELFRNYAEETHDSIPISEITSAIDLLISAYLGRFDHLEKEISFIRLFENKPVLPFNKMLNALCIWAYLNVMKRVNINTIALCWENPVFEGADSDECSVDSAIVYFEALADDIGDKFDKSRKAFDYHEFKNTFKRLSTGQVK